MTIYLGSDHGGYASKQILLNYLQSQGYKVTDCGSYSAEATDYPDFALAVGKAVTEDSQVASQSTSLVIGHYIPVEQTNRLGILLCRSGEGMEIAANKVPGVRAALVWDSKVARESRQDNDANILVLPADFLTSDTMQSIVLNFLTTPFSKEERHLRRLEKMHAIERLSSLHAS